MTSSPCLCYLYLMLDQKPHPARATYDAKTLAHQDAFLLAFAKLGTISSASHAAQISEYETVRLWLRDNTLGFKERYAIAQLQFAEYLETVALERVETPTNNGRTGSDVLLIAMLNANHPTKWRRDTVVIGSDVAKEMLGELFKLAQRSKPVVEGSATPVQEAEAQVQKMLQPPSTETT